LDRDGRESQLQEAASRQVPIERARISFAPDPTVGSKFPRSG
jgi:hypothetical protein